MDSTRQYGKTLSDIRKDHVERYRFASSLVDGKVIDAACGCGYGSRILFDAGCQVLGVDIEQEALDWAATFFPGPIYAQGDVQTAKLPLVDCVVSFETLEHLERPEKALERFRRCTELLIASVPNEKSYPFRAEIFVGDKYPHKRHYTPDEFADLLLSCGWHVAGRWTQADKFSKVEAGDGGRFLIYVCR